MYLQISILYYLKYALQLTCHRITKILPKVANNEAKAHHIYI